MATRWQLTHQVDDLPLSLSNEDGVPTEPPAEVADYIERAFGPWTLAPATKPLAVQIIEWPRLCDIDGFTGCPGEMSYLDSVPYNMSTGEVRTGHGWRCDVCGLIDVGDGLRSRVRTFIEYKSH